MAPSGKKTVSLQPEGAIIHVHHHVRHLARPRWLSLWKNDDDGGKVTRVIEKRFDSLLLG